MRKWVIRSEAGFLALRYSLEAALRTGQEFSNRWSNIRIGVAIMNHPNLSNEINDAISQSERDGGVWLKNIKKGQTVRVQTQNTLYEIGRTDEGFRIKGSPRYCPDWRRCNIHGSTWGGSMLKMDYLGRGMFIEMTIQGNDGIIITSRVKEITY